MKSKRRVSRSALRSPQPALEALENRTLLTGNVVASVVAGGNLLILGDSKANQIGIETTSGGALQITSLDGTTRINGSTSPFTPSGVTGSVFVFLGAGNDVLQVGGGSPATTIPHDLLIGLGNGNDSVSVATTSIGGNLDIFGGRGGDTISVGSAASSSAVSVSGNVFIAAGCG